MKNHKDSATTGNHGLGVAIMVDCELAGSLNKYGFAQADNVWSVKGVCPTVLAYNGGQIGHQINILEEDDEQETNAPRVLAGEEMETSESGVRSGGGYSQR